MATYNNPIDVTNRALQHLGLRRIAAYTDNTRSAAEAGTLYDKLRAAELQRVVWTFAVRRAVMRAIVSDTDTVQFAAYNSATTYAPGDIVKDPTGYLWLSVVGSNTGNTPGLGGGVPFWLSYFGPVIAQNWSGTVAYIPGDIVYTSPNVYICVLAHKNHAQPNATYWHVIAGATLSGGVSTVPYTPIGYTPDGSTVRNIHRLPANFLRMAAQDPKAVAAERLTVSAEMQYHDWELESGFMFTNDADPIVLRFVADQSDVATMDPIFCEVWAARQAVELCLVLTQSIEKLNTCLGLYARYTRIARNINAVESGSTEEDEDDVGQAPQPAQPAQQRGQ